MSSEYPNAGTGLQFLSGTAWTLHYPDCKHEWDIFWPSDRRRPILMKEAGPKEEDLSQFDISRDALGWPLSNAINQMVNVKGLSAGEVERRIRQALQNVQEGQ